MLVDLRPKNATGRAAEKALDRANITCNKNAIPFDTEKPAITSGIRLGSPAGTTRGFGPAEFKEVGKMDCRSGRCGCQTWRAGDPAVEASVRERVDGSLPAFPDLSIRGDIGAHALPVLRT